MTSESHSLPKTSPLKVAANDMNLDISAGIITSSDSAPNARKINLNWPWCLPFNITTAQCVRFCFCLLLTESRFLPNFVGFGCSIYVFLTCHMCRARVCVVLYVFMCVHEIDNLLFCGIAFSGYTSLVRKQY